MAAIPGGVTTAIVNITPPDGVPAHAVNITVTPTVDVTWSATSVKLADCLDTGSKFNLILPVVDQAGWITPAGSSFKGWQYIITISGTVNGVHFSESRMHQVVTGQTSVDLDVLNQFSQAQVKAYSDTRYVQLGAAPYDLNVVGALNATTRAVGLNDNPMGIKLPRAVTFSSVTFRAATADASGNTVVELRKNGSTVSGTSTTIAAASQVAGGTSTGTWAFAAGDIVTVYISAIGTTPGKAIVADLKGVAN